MPDIWPARGHRAQILVFDEETALLPLSEHEASRLHFALNKQYERLIMSGDFPEQKDYEDLLCNLSSAMWLLSAAERSRK